ncbi:Protein MgtC [Rhodovastum atsumiense]|uniref:Protein MgtC n=1 Tax=Rhodovastum atsumiense TaxID=504468 RepID=A0A5M6IZT3_9PROT|nr:MgtC/SapB family protein [Rhodovastum atsumiense]KAA5612858.1 MgtC/SapB family protein [Rhodovastum atsumiense]CAH2601073.1 Protein MgtC [Rhodovastum atsumiense]
MDAQAFPTMLTERELLLRLGLACLLGMLLGLDREARGLPAGIRTHGLSALSAASVTLCGLILYAEVRAGGGEADPLRVVQGIAQAIAFIGAGLVFVARGDVHNLTSAANIWLAAAVGIAAGLGLPFLAALTTLFGVFLLVVMRLVEHLIPGSDKAGKE